MDFCGHVWCVENNSRHLTRDLLLGPFPQLALHGPTCHRLTCAPHSLPSSAQKRAGTVALYLFKGTHLTMPVQWEQFSRDTRTWVSKWNKLQSPYWSPPTTDDLITKNDSMVWFDHIQLSLQFKQQKEQRMIPSKIDRGSFVPRLFKRVLGNFILIDKRGIYKGNKHIKYWGQTDQILVWSFVCGT